MKTNYHTDNIAFEDSTLVFRWLRWRHPDSTGHVSTQVLVLRPSSVPEKVGVNPNRKLKK
jgi:hypothetical protein